MLRKYFAKLVICKNYPVWMRIKRNIALLLLTGFSVHLVLWLTDNLHLYKAIASTYLIGSTGPNLDDYKRFPSHLIKASHQKNLSWPRASTYNTYSLPSSYADSLHYWKTKAFLVIRNDSLLFEQYYEGYTPHTLSNSFSVAKTITAIAVGMAIKDGYLPGTKTRIINYIPTLKGPYAKSITIQHLLQMASGINFDENYDNPLGYMAKVYYGKNIMKRTLSYTAEEPPGQRWFYAGGNTLLLSYLLRKTSHQSLAEYIQKKIWKHIAENDAYWIVDNQGDEKSYCCFYATARDYAKIGKLLLDSLKINSIPLVTPDFYKEMISPPHNLKDENNQPLHYYGYHLWLLTYKNEKIIYARGIKGQYIFVIPSKRTIVVRLGEKRSKEKIGILPSDIFVWLNIAFDIIS